MPVGVVVRVLAGWARRPGPTIALAALVLLAPALSALSPFPLASGSKEALIYEFAFLDAHVFGALALAGTGSLRWLLGRATARERLVTELVLIAAATALATLVALGLQCSLPPLAGASWTGPAAAAALAIPRLAVLGLLLLRFDLPAGVRPWILLGLAWFLPAMLGDRGLLALTAVSIPEASGLSRSSAPPSAEIASMLALLLAAWLLERRPTLST